MSAKELYIGLMSGTSMDGVDAVLVDLSNEQPTLVAHHNETIPTPLLAQLHQLANPNEGDINLLGRADQAVAELFATATRQLIAQSGLRPDEIRAIGSHGQTVRHVPEGAYPFSLQIGDGNRIAAMTGIDTIADFRRKDMALGGQGAPLVPAFHQHLFARAGQPRMILNIGGIANITWLPGDDQPILGFDTGPGNTLMDCWCQEQTGHAYDDNGQWAATGTVHQPLLQQLTAHPYFAQPAPKSTGRELFNADFLLQHLGHCQALRPQDVQATLCQFTADTIAQSIEGLTDAGEIFVCGGGVYNHNLMLRLAQRLPDFTIASTAALGVNPHWVEAIAFAWLAQRHLQGLPGNVPAVTGASREAVLGVHYPAG